MDCKMCYLACDYRCYKEPIYNLRTDFALFLTGWLAETPISSSILTLKKGYLRFFNLPYIYKKMQVRLKHVCYFATTAIQSKMRWSILQVFTATYVLHKIKIAHFRLSTRSVQIFSLLLVCWCHWDINNYGYLLLNYLFHAMLIIFDNVRWLDVGKVESPVVVDGITTYKLESWVPRGVISKPF